jgi:hypothetical protein
MQMPFLKRLDGPELFGEVKKVLNRLTNARTSFTKYDVTQEVRTNVGNEIEVLHSDVRLEVENLMPQAFKNYDGRFDPTIGAFKYRPVAKTIDTNKTPSGYVQGPPVAVTSCSGLDSNGNDHTYLIPTLLPTTGNALAGPKTLTQVVSANKKGVCVPKNLVKAATSKRGAFGIAGRIFVSIPRSGGMAVGTSYQPDQYGNFTILNKTLCTKQGDKVEISVNGDQISVKKL